MLRRILLSILIIPLNQAYAEQCSAPPSNGQLYSIANISSGQVIDIAEKSKVAGAGVVSWDYKKQSNQQFYLNDQGNGRWTIQARHS